MTSRVTEINVDCADPAGLAGFWCAALGYSVLEATDGLVEVGPERGSDAVLLEAVRREPVAPSIFFARARGGPQALGVRDALELATIGGARVLGWDDQIGSIEQGKLADLALWRVDTLPHADLADPVAGLVLGSPPPLELLLVGGSPVVERDRLVNADEEQLARSAVAANATMLQRAGLAS
jgi:hypothetical protein